MRGVHAPPSAEFSMLDPSSLVLGPSSTVLEPSPWLLASAIAATAALLVNAVPAVLAARPGFYPPACLVPNPPWLAEHRPPGAP